MIGRRRHAHYLFREAVGFLLVTIAWLVERQMVFEEALKSLIADGAVQVEDGVDGVGGLRMRAARAGELCSGALRN